MKFNYLVEACNANFGGTKVTKKVAEELIKNVFENIQLALEKGETITVRGFGAFKPKERKARVYVEPRTKKEVKKGATTFPKFIPSKLFKERLNSK